MGKLPTPADLPTPLKYTVTKEALNPFHPSPPYHTTSLHLTALAPWSVSMP